MLLHGFGPYVRAGRTLSRISKTIKSGVGEQGASRGRVLKFPSEQAKKKPIRAYLWQGRTRQQRLWAIPQTLLSAAFLFLFALALRNHFRIR